MALATAFLGGRFYPHYFLPLDLPLALAAAPEALRLLTPPVGRAGRGFVAATAVLWFGFSAADLALYYARDDVYVETRPVFARVADRLRRDACSGPLFVWGFAPQFYTATALAPASRFVMVGATLVGHVSGRADHDAGAVSAEHWEWLFSDLARRPPAFVLDAAGARLSRWDVPLERYPRLAAFVSRGYEPLDRIDGVAIYRRRGCAVQRAAPTGMGAASAAP